MRTGILLLSVLLVLAGCNRGAANNTASAPYSTQVPSPGENAADMNLAMASENMMATANDAGNDAGDLPITAPTLRSGNQMVAGPAADGTVFCELIQDRVPAAECDYYREFLARLEQGSGALQAPARMTRNRPARVRFAVARPGRPGHPAAVTNPGEMLPGASTPTGPVLVGRRMAVELSGDGFTVTPAGQVERDLSIGGGARWDWEVTPTQQGRRQLQLTAYVVVRAPGQASGTPNFLRSFSHDVEVIVDRGDRVREFMERWTGWVTRVNGLMVALTALFAVGIAGLFGALKRPIAWLKGLWRRLRGLPPAEPVAPAPAAPVAPSAPPPPPAGT